MVVYVCVCVCGGGGGGGGGACSLILSTKPLIPRPLPLLKHSRPMGIANDPAIFKDSLLYLKISQNFGVLISILLTERG